MFLPTNHIYYVSACASCSLADNRTIWFTSLFVFLSWFGIQNFCVLNVDYVHHEIFLTILYFLAFKERREGFSNAQLTRGFRRKQRAGCSLILHYSKPDYSKISPKVDCSWKPKLNGNDKVSGAVTCRMVQKKLRNVPHSFLIFPFYSFASIMLYCESVI
jgi:hypothetical protein